MIYITGDIHGDPIRFSTNIFPEQKEMTKDDYVIICGDFGLVWDYKGESKYECNWLNWLEEKPFTTLFVDGNHECHDRLDQYPVEEWKSGKVSFIRPSVIHLKRGQVFEIENKKFFTFGGASSHDISAGILEPDDPDFKKKQRKLNKNPYALYRVNHRTWWERELPSEEEMQNGFDNLEKHNWKIDYIVTHTPPASIITLLGQGLYEQDKLTEYLEEIKCQSEYNYWFAGHMHLDKAISKKDILLYEQIIRII